MDNLITREEISSSKYLPTLDGWRAIAILLVLFAHAIYSIQDALARMDIYANLMPYSSSGLLGVHIFFVISGFLITRNMLNEEKANGRLAIGRFYYRRFFRIIPAALVFLLVLAMLSFLKIISINIGEWFSALLFWGNYTHVQKSWYTGHFWSLAVEEHFYIFWPFLFVLFRSNKNRTIFLIVTTVVVAIWRAAAHKWWLTGDTPAYFWGRTDVQVDNIAYGALAAVLYEFERFQRLIALMIKYHRVTIISAVAVILIEYAIDFSDRISLILLSVNPALIAIMLVFSTKQRGGLLFRLLETKILGYIGIISYSTYLWQELFLNRSDSIPPKLALVQSFPINFVLVFACAFLSYKLVEMPMIRLGRRLSRRPDRSMRHGAVMVKP